MPHITQHYWLEEASEFTKEQLEYLLRRTDVMKLSAGRAIKDIVTGKTGFIVATQNDCLLVQLQGTRYSYSKDAAKKFLRVGGTTDVQLNF